MEDENQSAEVLVVQSTFRHPVIKQDVFRLWSTVIEYKFGLFSSASTIEGFVN